MNGILDMDLIYILEQHALKAEKKEYWKVPAPVQRQPPKRKTQRLLRRIRYSFPI